MASVPAEVRLSVPRPHLKPGQKGTKHLVGQYGDRLLCVRYRYDAVRKKRIKTVELVVAESDWEPRFAPDEIVALRVAYGDVATRKRVKYPELDAAASSEKHPDAEAGPAST